MHWLAGFAIVMRFRPDQTQLSTSALPNFAGMDAYVNTGTGVGPQGEPQEAAGTGCTCAMQILPWNVVARDVLSDGAHTTQRSFSHLVLA